MPAWLSFGFLLLSLGFYWTRWQPYWPLPFLTAVAAGLITAVLSWSAVAGLGLFWLAAAINRHSRGLPAYLGLAAVLFLGLILGLHVIPGFQPVLIVDDAVIKAGSIPYTLRLHFDKAAVGLLLLYYVCRHQDASISVEAFIKRLWPVLTATVAGIMIAAMLSGWVNWQPAVPDIIFYWIGANLFITCLAEETFFRGLIQPMVANALKRYRYATVTAIAVTALLFGLAHLGGGVHYAALATLAGVGYGAAYAVTGRIEAAISTHFSVNLIHLLFFTYPANAGLM